MEILGRKPRPRVLLLNFAPDVEESLAKLLPTVKGITDLRSIRQVEWDVLVTQEGVPPWAEPHLFVIATGGDVFGRPDDDADFDFDLTEISYSGRSQATELALPSNLSKGLATPVREQILQPALSRDWHSTIVEGSRTTQERDGVPAAMKPFLLTEPGECLAGSFVRKGGLAECWVLPQYVAPWAFLAVALSIWSDIDPDRFPPRPRWKDRLEWETPDEKEVRIAIESATDKRVQVEAELVRIDSELAERYRETSAAADKGLRRLLTAQGDELKSTVIDALVAMGFEVVDVDEQISTEGDRLEDLRVSPPGESDWESIVEVRGYKGGAQVRDLMRLQRFQQRYQQDEGTPPRRHRGM